MPIHPAPVPPEDDLEAASGEGLLGRFNFLDYLDELRRRLIISCAAVVVGFLLACFFIGPLFRAFLQPLEVLQGGRFIYTDPAEAFLIQLQVALIAGIVLAVPVVFFQLWALAAPALRRFDRGFVVPFVVAATLFFVAGAVFNHFVVFPISWRFLGSFGNDYVTFRPKIGPTFSLYVRLMLALGLVFEMPTVVFLLARMGLADARFLARHFKYAVLLAFVISAVVTPTADAFTQTLLAAPMILLYVISIGVAWLFKKRRDPAD